ncbi:hypothetical protein SNE40_007676 [Patella caerulea]|uniref:Apple domain-containing protein n=1 Tax=Patella caerulea TaxID=87958 RepID=A0AAN8PVD2_PATCE
MNFLIPFIAVLLLVATSTDVSANIRYVHARAVTSTDHYLDVVPIEETLTSSVMCVKLCATDVRCLSINYHKNKTCQLLDTFYCKDNTYVLKSESGFKYMDVDFNRQPDEMKLYQNSVACVSQNRCSPKCRDACVLRSAYSNVVNGYIDGTLATLDDTMGVTMGQCQNTCISHSTGVCIAIQYFPIIQSCTYLSMTRDMVHPELFKYSFDLEYRERVCI